jgi:hypothetical protein
MPVLAEPRSRPMTSRARRSAAAQTSWPMTRQGRRRAQHRRRRWAGRKRRHLPTPEPGGRISATAASSTRSVGRDDVAPDRPGTRRRPDRLQAGAPTLRGPATSCHAAGRPRGPISGWRQSGRPLGGSRTPHDDVERGERPRRCRSPRPSPARQPASAPSCDEQAGQADIEPRRASQGRPRCSRSASAWMPPAAARRSRGVARSVALPASSSSARQGVNSSRCRSWSVRRPLSAPHTRRVHSRSGRRPGASRRILEERVHDGHHRSTPSSRRRAAGDRRW